MKGTPYLYLLLLYFLFASCKKKAEQNISFTQKNEPHFLMTIAGDSIPTGVPIPAKGKWIHPDSVDKPEIIQLRGKPHVVPAYSNAFPASTPEVIQIPKNLTVTSPGKNGIPAPKTVPVRGKIVPAIQPPPLPALPIQMNDAAFAGIRILDVEQGMSSSRIRSILEDSRGNLWFGTFDNGVTCYDGRQFFHYPLAEGLSFNTVWSILEDSRGNLWFGTRGGGVNRYDGKSFIHFTTKEGLSNDIVWSMLEDSRGNIWISTWGGVDRYTPSESGTDGTFTHYTTKEGLIGDQIRCMLEDSQGDIWFGTNNKGVSRFDPEANNGQGSFTHYPVEEG